MGLQSQLNDISSDSIPLLVVAMIAGAMNQLRSFLHGIFQSMGFLPRLDPDPDQGRFLGSGLANLVVLAEQLNINRVFSYRYCCRGDGSDCVVCLSTLRDGDRVRMLDCRHVFHKDCFDGWLDHLHFTCPLCRTPLVSDERVAVTRRRVGGDLLAWFPLR
ncbi:E3 ubiquitin-protein ligase RHA2A [Carica papaya]|uniref:E3 ubiquitin-protein ligase RHA2A n=1 Tax=Carica papaya TaxID=3649 RepID=UPI000B8C8C7D|nr:E3 ubiquitin-protein ligase RHA2A [Carica papaya]